MTRRSLEDWASQLSPAEAREALSLEKIIESIDAARREAAERLEAIKKRAYMRTYKSTRTELRRTRWRGGDAAAGQSEVREDAGDDPI